MKFIEKIKKVGFLQTLDDLTGNIFSYIRYVGCKLSNRVYIGSYLAATQGKVIRHYYMQKLVEHYCHNVNDAIKILEIGSWAGGSAITWAEALKKYSKQGGMILCIDQWVNYLDSLDSKLWTHKTMKKALKSNKIYSLFLHNIAASKHNDIVFTFKGSSAQNLPMLKNNQFDIIFIDGDHSYEGVYSDIEKSAPLLKNEGLICGDDLELQYPSIDKENIEKVKNSDISIDPLTNKRFHSGVTLAVWEYFKGEVSCYEGFWAMQKSGDSWQKISIACDGDIHIPAHLNPSECINNP